MNIKSKLLLIWILSVATCFSFLQAEDATVQALKDTEQTLCDATGDCDDCDCITKVEIHKLCAKKIKAHKGRFKKLCADHFKTDFICTDTITVNHLLNMKEICTQSLSTNDLCVSGIARIEEVCGNYRAFADYSADTTYTLGTPLNYDDILDNPDGDLTAAPTTFTTPVSGYYIISLAIHQLSIAPVGPVLGVPTAVLTVLVNGTPQRSSFFPYLTFNSAQDSSLSALLRLNAGDLVTATYTNLVVDQTLGTINLPGTVVIGGGTGASFFAIHYLSSNCEVPSCTPCTPAEGTSCDNHCEPFCDKE
jgi:hypothetical protein